MCKYTRIHTWPASSLAAWWEQHQQLLTGKWEPWLEGQGLKTVGGQGGQGVAGVCERDWGVRGQMPASTGGSCLDTRVVAGQGVWGRDACPCSRGRE